MSTFIEDDLKKNKDKPAEFTDVIKPADVETTRPAPDMTMPPESQDSANMVAASISESKEWKPFMSQLNDAQIKDVKLYAPKEQFQIEVDGQIKTYARRKIKSKEYAVLESLRAKLASAKPADRSAIVIETYQKAMLYYLGMSEEDFDNADYETIKKIVDANNIRTLYGVPNSQ